MNRRPWFQSLAGGACTLIAVRLGQSSSDVPRQVDCRKHRDAWTVPVDIYRHGVKQRLVVAYDLDAGWMVRYRETPSGKIYIEGDDFAVETLHGGVVVRWSADA